MVKRSTGAAAMLCLLAGLACGASVTTQPASGPTSAPATRPKPASVAVVTFDKILTAIPANAAPNSSADFSPLKLKASAEAIDKQWVGKRVLLKMYCEAPSPSPGGGWYIHARPVVVNFRGVTYHGCANFTLSKEVTGEEMLDFKGGQEVMMRGTVKGTNFGSVMEWGNGQGESGPGVDLSLADCVFGKRLADEVKAAK